MRVCVCQWKGEREGLKYFRYGVEILGFQLSKICSYILFAVELILKILSYGASHETVNYIYARTQIIQIPIIPIADLPYHGVKEKRLLTKHNYWGFPNKAFKRVN
jgi:hypothetical protein